MATSSIDKEFQAWLDVKGITDPHSRHEMLDQFLYERNLPAQIEKDVAAFVAAHPDYIVCESNKAKIDFFLDLYDLKPIRENLERAFEHLSKAGSLALRKPEPAYDPDKPETRAGQWTNGVFRPFEPGGTRSGKSYLMGQITPGAEEAIIRKNHRNMSADEYLKAINTSRAFQKKMDESK